MCEIAPLDPDEVGQDQSRVVDGDTGPSVSHTSHLFEGKTDKEKLCCYGRISGCLGSLMGSPRVAGV